MTKSLQDFQRELSEEIRKDKTPPRADLFDTDKYPYSKAPGANKLGLMVCATCGKPPTKTDRNDLPYAFLFCDELSAKEYYCSGMCQECQDNVYDSKHYGRIKQMLVRYEIDDICERYEIDDVCDNYGDEDDFL